MAVATKTIRDFNIRDFSDSVIKEGAHPLLQHVKSLEGLETEPLTTARTACITAMKKLHQLHTANDAIETFPTPIGPAPTNKEITAAGRITNDDPIGQMLHQFGTAMINFIEMLVGAKLITKGSRNNFSEDRVGLEVSNIFGSKNGHVYNMALSDKEPSDIELINRVGSPMHLTINQGEELVTARAA